MNCGALIFLSARDPPSYAVVSALSKCRKPPLCSALCLRSVEPLPSKLGPNSSKSRIFCWRQKLCSSHWSCLLWMVDVKPSTVRENVHTRESVSIPNHKTHGSRESVGPRPMLMKQFMYFNWWLRRSTRGRPWRELGKKTPSCWIQRWLSVDRGVKPVSLVKNEQLSRIFRKSKCQWNLTANSIKATCTLIHLAAPKDYPGHTHSVYWIGVLWQ